MENNVLLYKALDMLGISQQQLAAYKPYARNDAVAIAHAIVAHMMHKQYRNIDDFVSRVNQEGTSYYYTGYTNCKQAFPTFETFYDAMKLARSFCANGTDNQVVSDLLTSFQQAE